MLEEFLKPTIIIPLESYQKIMAYTELADGEITQFADISYDKERNALVMGEVYLLKQKAGGAHVEMDEEIIADFNLQLIKRGVNQLPRCWIHSHVDFDTFFSGTDTDTIDQLKNETFTVAIVVNKSRKMHALLRIWQPLVLTIDELPIEIDFNYGEIPKVLRDEVKEKVKEDRPIWGGKGKKDKSDRDDDIEVSKILYFPDDINTIKERVRAFKLKRRWDSQRGEYTWYDPILKTLWIDFHNAIDNPWDEDFGEVYNDDVETVSLTDDPPIEKFYGKSKKKRTRHGN